MPDEAGFRTVFGRGLLPELRAFVHRPALVVTMEDLWPLVRDQVEGDHLAGVHFVHSLEVAELERDVAGLPDVASVVGIGGGQAIDVAKYIAWRTRRPLFQVPTATSVNAPFGHRSGVRVDGVVRYVGWAIPEAVYVDFDVIAGAPALLNRSGIGDVLCYHTAHADWKLAHELGRCEPSWPYDIRLVEQARSHLDAVLGALDDIKAGTEHGVRTLVAAHRWGGATFHDAGWNPRHIEGVDHFVFYNLERLTGRHFIHGQPVGLGTVAGAVLQDNAPERIADAYLRAGVDIRPEAMGVTWADVDVALRTLGAFVREAGLWFTVADVRPFSDALVARVHDLIVDRWGPWEEGR